MLSGEAGTLARKLPQALRVDAFGATTKSPKLSPIRSKPPRVAREIANFPHPKSCRKVNKNQAITPTSRIVELAVVQILCITAGG
jgi:hypothetical protein